MVSRDPLDPDNFGKQNVGIYRMEVKGKRKLGLQPVPMHDIALHLHKAEERGEDLPIAITLGNDPIITLMGATPLKYDQSEYEMAGALRESPYPIATAPLTGFDVPWGSEVILEGVIESRKREIEGPFGEFTGHYSGGRNMTVVRIDKVSYRSKPIFESLYLGMPWTEIDYLMGPHDLRATVSTVESRISGSAGGKRHVHPRPAGHHLNQKTLRRLCPCGGPASDDDAARSGICEDGDHGR